MSSRGLGCCHPRGIEFPAPGFGLAQPDCDTPLGSELACCGSSVYYVSVSGRHTSKKRVSTPVDP